MNKFLDLLSRGRKTSNAPIGFGTMLTSKHQRKLLLIASVPNITTRSKTVLKCDADAILFDESILPILPTLTDQLSDLIWGINLSNQKSDETIKSNDPKADFLVVQQNAPINGYKLFNDTGLFLDVLPNLDERFVRALDTLPIDGLTLRGLQNQPLTFNTLLAIASLRTMCDKYILVELPDSLKTSELNALGEIGVDGILVDTETSSIKSINHLAKALDKLPPPEKTKQRIRTRAILSESNLQATLTEDDDNL